MKTRTLTEHQRDVVGALRLKDATLTAASVERAWLAGEQAFVDDRNSAARGLIRAIERGNREALEDARP